MLWHGAPVFDGERLHEGYGVLVEAGRVVAVGPEARLAGRGEARDACGGILMPGFVDLQVNGGGGLLLGEATGPDGVATIAAAHRALGTGHLLPTLISDTPEATEAAIAAVEAAIAAGVPGVAGLHLEGPHIVRAGAHDPARLRPMEARDLALCIDAARRLPCLVVTLAPEAASLDQIAALARAGVVVSLGHTEADHATASAAFAAGARMVTHLFNAMPPLLHRAPGLVAAALEAPDIAAGLIADGHHLHPSVLGLALRAARGDLFLVSDAMAVAGTGLDRFRLGEREVFRRNGRLELADGTLAGADLDLARAIKVLVDAAGVPLVRALAMATSVPARVAGLGAGVGRLRAGAAGLVRFDPEAGTARPLMPADAAG